MRVIGFDLDGIVTRVGLYNPSIRLPWWLFYLLVPLVSSLKPDDAMIKKMQILRQKGYKIIIVTARPAQLAEKTERWLVKHHVPFDSLYCVGFGKGTEERKFEVIRDREMELFIDNDDRFVDFLKRKSVNAVTTLEHL